MTKLSDFSIIIVNYNSTQDLIKAVKSFIAAHQNALKSFEFIIIDNHSHSSEFELLQKFISKQNQQTKIRHHLHQLPHNQGYGYANNYALNFARGEYLLFLNPDTCCQFALLDQLYSVLQNKKVAFAAPQLLLTNGEKQPQAYGQFPTLFSLIFKKLSSSKEKQNKKTNFNTDWLSGACFACKKSIFELLGGFSPTFFMYYEDVDLCRQARAHHLQCQIIPSLSIIHYGGERQQLTRTRRSQYFAAQSQYFKIWHPFSAFFLPFIRLPYKLICYFYDQP